MNRFDVVICGGGFAGLSLARQLALYQPERSVAVVERRTRPLPTAAFKVGESTVEASGYYVSQVLQLGDHLAKRQFKKCGLRYFFQDSQQPHVRRPEMGLSKFPVFDSFQLDRGVLETELRDLVGKTARLLEGYAVSNVTLGGGDQDHRVDVTAPGGSSAQLAARWVIDATGRRRMLQRSLHLERRRAAEPPFHSTWFRVPGRIDVDAFVPASETAWHERVAKGARYFSTNHLIGRGYWVWIIPLASGFTSVGVVAHGGVHPFETLHTQALTMAWIAEHEPTLSRALEGVTPIDFLCFKDYSYSVTQVFSHDRWACVGESGLFADPFYSPGMWQIGLSNSAAAEMIRLDQLGALRPEEVASMNEAYVQLNDELTRGIQSTFEYSHHAVVTAMKILWDFATGWALTGALMINGALVDPARRAHGLNADPKVWHLARIMRALFTQWGARSRGTFAFGFLDYQGLPFMLETYLRTVAPGKSADEMARDHEKTMELLEELVQVIFLFALEDCMPEALERMPAPLWLNAWGVGLDPALWDRRRLFQPLSAPRDLSPLRQELRAVFERAPADAAASALTAG